MGCAETDVLRVPEELLVPVMETVLVVERVTLADLVIEPVPEIDLVVEPGTDADLVVERVTEADLIEEPEVDGAFDAEVVTVVDFVDVLVLDAVRLLLRAAAAPADTLLPVFSAIADARDRPLHLFSVQSTGACATSGSSACGLPRSPLDRRELSVGSRPRCAAANSSKVRSEKALRPNMYC